MCPSSVLSAHHTKPHLFSVLKKYWGWKNKRRKLWPGVVERWPEDAGLEYGQDTGSQNHAGRNSFRANFQTFLFLLLPKSSTSVATLAAPLP